MYLYVVQPKAPDHQGHSDKLVLGGDDVFVARFDVGNVIQQVVEASGAHDIERYVVVELCSRVVPFSLTRVQSYLEKVMKFRQEN